jgi:hypothetical protein
LLSNDRRDTRIHRLMGGLYEVHCEYSLSCRLIVVRNTRVENLYHLHSCPERERVGVPPPDK